MRTRADVGKSVLICGPQRLCQAAMKLSKLKIRTLRSCYATVRPSCSSQGRWCMVSKADARFGASSPMSCPELWAGLRKSCETIYLLRHGPNASGSALPRSMSEMEPILFRSWPFHCFRCNFLVLLVEPLPLPPRPLETLQFLPRFGVASGIRDTPGPSSACERWELDGLHQFG